VNTHRLPARLMVKAATFTFFRVVHRPMEWLVRRFSCVGQREFFDPSAFAWIPTIEAGWTGIRQEARALLSHREQIPSFEDIAPTNTPGQVMDGKWKTFWLIAYGRKLSENCQSCPETTRLIESIPGIKTAFFSILAPGKHLPEHTGPYTGLLRYHLGLIVPRQKEACRIRVGSKFAHWEEGRSLVFDDTYLHEVWNDTEEERVVLFVDFARPLPFPVSLLNEAVIWLASRSAFVQDIMDNADLWNGRRGGRKTASTPAKTATAA
jgi:aspartyl/asparaginyl beta-hydroxylase (cupin superfamily)